MFDSNKHKKGLEKEEKFYRELERLSKSEDFESFYKVALKATADKMVWAFSENNVSNWDDFCKVRGEVIAWLYPLQEINGAKATRDHIRQQLDEYYGKEG